MRTAEWQCRHGVASDPPLQFRIPRSEFRICLMLHTTFRVGRLTCHALEGGTQRLDGGAMFGVVPKPLWQRRIPPDERNRITQARYVVQAKELDFARHTNERTAASYLSHNFASVPFTVVTGEAGVLPGIRCLPTPGHVPYHQSILIESGGERACFVADLVPTTAHLPLPWIMGYDLEPLVTLESKRSLYRRAGGGAGR